jgi:hypothetical protein
MKQPAGPYTVTWVDDVFGIDPEDDNVDVTVTFEGGDRYTATFFTLTNLAALMENYAQTGECANGLYIWSTHMIVIARVTRQNIERAIDDLLKNGEFAAAFDGPFTD